MRELEVRRRDADVLPAAADQVHLDARLVGVPDGAVDEAVEVEVAAELAVDADEQVAVERRRHAERIVVGEQQIALRLHEIGAESSASPRRERRADARAGTRRRPADRSCRCSIRETAPASGRRARRSRVDCGRPASYVAWCVTMRTRRAPRACAPMRSARGRDVDQMHVESLRRDAAPDSSSVSSFSPLPGPSSTSVVSGPTRAQDLARRARRAGASRRA